MESELLSTKLIDAPPERPVTLPPIGAEAVPPHPANRKTIAGKRISGEMRGGTSDGIGDERSDGKTGDTALFFMISPFIHCKEKPGPGFRRALMTCHQTDSLAEKFTALTP